MYIILSLPYTKYVYAKHISSTRTKPPSYFDQKKSPLATHQKSSQVSRKGRINPMSLISDASKHFSPIQKHYFLLFSHTHYM